MPLGPPSTPGPAPWALPEKILAPFLFLSHFRLIGTRSKDQPSPPVHSEATGHIVSNTPHSFRGSLERGLALRRACWVLAHLLCGQHILGQVKPGFLSV